MKYEQYGEREMYEEIYETVCDVVCVKRRTIRINGEDYPYELVKSRFLKLNSGHVAYVMDCMKNAVTKITNIRAYLITALYNAPSTMSHYRLSRISAIYALVSSIPSITSSFPTDRLIGLG